MEDKRQGGAAQEPQGDKSRAQRQESSGKASTNRAGQGGVGSGAAQDRGSSKGNDRPSTQEGSMVNESTGAFKERP